MQQASSWSQLEMILKAKIAAAMKDEGKFLENKVKQHVETDVYSYTPEVYERTGQLKDSVRANTPEVNGDTISVTVDHDLDAITANPPNQHHSVVADYSPQDVSDWIPYIVTQGKSGLIFGEGAWTEPRDYMENTKDELEGSKEHVDKLVTFLRNQGLNAKRT